MDFKLKAGEKFNRNPNKPIICINGKGNFCYLWIGNNAADDQFCFATLSGKKTLQKFAKELLKALK